MKIMKEKRTKKTHMTKILVLPLNIVINCFFYPRTEGLDVISCLTLFVRFLKPSEINQHCNYI